MFRNDINVHDYNRQLQNSDVKEFNLGCFRERRLMSSRRLHMSDVENEKSEGLAYTKVFKGKHTFQNAHKSNSPFGLTHTRWPYCHRAMPLDFAHRADAQSGRAYRLRNLISQS